MAMVTPLLPFLPLAAKQILLNNFLSDLPAMAISGDRVDADGVSRPQRWDIGEVRRFMLVFGLVSTVFDLLTFAVLLLWLEAGQAQFQTTWFVVSLLTELAVLLVLRTRLPFWQSRPGTLLIVAAVAVAALALALPYAGGLAAAFGFVPLPASFVGAVLLIVCAYVVMTEVAKRVFYRHAAVR
jgi:Mg2+-importing ATPase